MTERKSPGSAPLWSLPDSPCQTMTSQTNVNNMSMTKDKRNASDFFVRARGIVTPVVENGKKGEKKKQKQKEN